MRRKGKHFGAVASLACVLSLSLVAAALAQVAYERPANRLVSDILSPKVIVGPHYRIRQTVVSYGYMHHFTVDSDFGVFEVTGDGALRKLLREIQAIAHLRGIRKSKAFAKSVKKSVTSPLRLTKNLITHPVDTVSGVPKGVFRIFSNVKTSITKKHDPSEDARVKQALFVSSWKRDYAYQLGIDVYSSNKVLQKELNSVGWAAALGGLTVSVATLPASATAVVILKQMRLADAMTNALKEEPPARLRLINQKKLSEMGIRKGLRERYLDHPAFTPRHDTILAASLAQLGNAAGRDAFLELALFAENEVDANFYMNIAQVLRGYHETVSPLREIRVSRLTLAQAQNGTALIPFPLDHGVWTEEAHRFLRELTANYHAPGFNGRFELWVTGTVSPLARKQLAVLGIKVVEDVDRRIEILD